MSNPRVLIVIAQLDRGGAERQVVNLANRLAPEGFEPEVAVFYPNGDLEPELRGAGIRVHQIRRTSKVGHESILHLSRILRKGRHGIVHSFLWPANWRSRLAGILAGTPVIISSTRSLETWLRPHHVTVDRLLARRTDAIIVNAEAIRDFLVRREKIPPRLIHVIRNGLDTTRFERLPGRDEARVGIGLPPGAPVVLSVGNLQPEKNHEDFLRMAVQVAHHVPDARFVLVGGGERRRALETAATELGLQEKVVWAGPQEEVIPFLAASDVFVNTSRREGCCNAILEAMAAGRPVVAFSVGGNPELIEPGRTGALVPFGDIAGLSAEVEGYLRDPARAGEHGREGSGRVAAQFSVQTMVSRTAELYRELLGKKQGGNRA